MKKNGNRDNPNFFHHERILSGQRTIASPAITQDETHVSRRDRTIESLIDLIDCICARWRLHMLNRQLYRAGSVAVCPADSYVTQPATRPPTRGRRRVHVHTRASSTRALAQRLALTGTYDHHDDETWRGLPRAHVHGRLSFVIAANLPRSEIRWRLWRGHY